MHATRGDIRPRPARRSGIGLIAFFAQGLQFLPALGSIIVFDHHHSHETSGKIAGNPAGNRYDHPVTGNWLRLFPLKKGNLKNFLVHDRPVPEITLLTE